MKNKKTLIFVIIGVAIVIVVIIGLIIFINNKKKEDAITMDFNHILLRTYNTAAGADYYEISKTEDGYLAEYYYQIDTWNNDTNQEETFRTAYHKVILTDEEYELIRKTLKDCKAYKWDGFHGTNSNILDGGGFSLEIELANGETITASGSNSYPNNYGDLAEVLNKLTTTELLKDTKFKTDKYEVTLPTKWVNNVRVRYADEYIAFYVEANGRDVTCFIIYENTYGFYEGDQYIKIAKFIKDENEYYVFCAKGSSVNSYKNDMNETQLDIIDTLDQDIEEIVASFKLNKEYTIVEE